MFVALLSSGEYIQLEEGESDVSIWQVVNDQELGTGRSRNNQDL